jgi:CIC family chloride channel protein
MLFGIEVIAGGIIGFSLIPVILASVLATSVTYTLLGNEVSFQSPLFGLSSPIELVFYLLLGILFGILSVIWTRGFYKIEDLFERIKVSRYLRPAIGGFITGALLLLTIYLEHTLAYAGAYKPGEPYYPAIAGFFYSFTDATLAGHVGLLILLSFGFLKALATAFTLGSGGSGGIFAPTLTIGVAFGGSFGLLFAMIFPWAIPAPMSYALVGMAALFAGTARAPLTCIVILMEMTHSYDMILPLMTAVSASYLVASLIEEDSIYMMKLTKRGIHIRQGIHVGALKAIDLEEVMTRKPTVLHPSMTQDEVLKIIDTTQHTKFPVVDDQGKIVGTLIAEDLFHDLPSDAPQPLVREMMTTDFLHLSPGCKMDSVLHAMIERDEGHAVVVDPKHPDRMIGFVTKADVLRAYELAISRLQQQGIEIEDIGTPDIVHVP